MTPASPPVVVARVVAQDGVQMVHADDEHPNRATDLSESSARVVDLNDRLGSFTFLAWWRDLDDVRGTGDYSGA